MWPEINWFLYETVLNVKHSNDSNAKRKAGEQKSHVIIWGHEKRPEGQPSKDCSCKTWRHYVMAVHRWRLLIICLFWTCCLLKAKACQILGRLFFKSFCCFSKQDMSPAHPLHKQTFLQIIRGMEFIWQRRQFCRDGSLRVWGFYCVCPSLCPPLLNSLLMHPV